MKGECSFCNFDNSINFYGPCYNRFDVFETDGLKIQKSSLGKNKNDDHCMEGV